MSDRSERLASLEGPHERGQAAEAIVKSELVSRGVSVLTPAYDNEPYDVAIELGGEFHRIQIKTAFEATTDGAVRFRTRSTRTKSSGYEPAANNNRANVNRHAEYRLDTVLDRLRSA